MKLTRRVNGVLLESVDTAGGVFAAVPGKPITVAYSWGGRSGKAQARNVMLTCPVSAIPDEVWNLLALWWQCRLTRMAPQGGGFLDQPAIIRRVFPLFEAEFRVVEQQQAANGSQNAAALAAGAVARVMGGGG